MLSLVRSNLVGQVGFVRDVRRLNVACTRARRHLCLITDSSTTSRAISGLIEYIEQHGEVRSAHQYLSEIEKLPVEDVHQKFELITKRPKAMKSEKLSENKGRCYARGAKGKKAHLGSHCKRQEEEKSLAI